MTNAEVLQDLPQPLNWVRGVIWIFLCLHIGFIRIPAQKSDQIHLLSFEHSRDPSMTTIRPVILCGGAGTRLWPLSSSNRPKQFQNLLGDASMLAETAERLKSSQQVSFSTPLIVASAKHGSLVRESVPQADCIFEPFGRDSAPAIAAAALASEPEQLLLISPADHFIADVDAFHRAIATGVEAARGGQMVTFGVKPDHPATGYGYIEADGKGDALLGVSRFVEKPDRTTAEQYVASGRFFWNAGIFLFRASAMIDALKAHAPAVLSGTQDALSTMSKDSGILGRQGFAKATRISIDYAVFEPESAKGAISVVPVDMGWRDIGDYKALMEARAEAGLANAGPALVIDAQNVMARSDGPFVAAIGMKDTAIIAENGAMLVCNLNASQDVKTAAKTVSGFGFGALVEDSLRQRVKDWLLEKALPLWAEIAWDENQGGFKETVDLSNPHRETSDYRRTRVQARQIYAFAHGSLLGWDGDAEGLAARGLAYLEEKCFREGRGYIHRLTPDGRPLDGRVDLYDQAFILNAFAWAFRAFSNEAYLKKAAALADLLDSRLCLASGGYADDDTGSELLRSNPHMHLLEAFLALYEATYDPDWLARAEQVVVLFETRFFDASTDTVIENFHLDWRTHSELGLRREPGHAYEWATLLTKFERHSGRDLKSWSSRLVSRADAGLRDPAKRLVENCIDASGETIDGNRRLWPQTERLRAKLIIVDHRGLAPAESLAAQLFDTYLADARPGLWMDEYSAAGEPVSQEVPASMLYHMVSGFSPIIDPECA